LGIEIVRIFVCKDSVYIIDRANKSYMVNTFEKEKSRFFGYLSVNDLQDIILGKICQVFDNKNFSLLNKGNVFSKFGMIEDIENENMHEKVQVNYVINNESQKIKELLISSNRSYFHFVYADYKIYEGILFPGRIEIESRTKSDKYIISLEIRDLKIVDFISSIIAIPNGYKRKF